MALAEIMLDWILASFQIEAKLQIVYLNGQEEKIYCITTEGERGALVGIALGRKPLVFQFGNFGSDFNDFK